jgi:hypothetical protein
MYIRTFMKCTNYNWLLELAPGGVIFWGYHMLRDSMQAHVKCMKGGCMGFRIILIYNALQRPCA